jgi:hypothetical protein
LPAETAYPQELGYSRIDIILNTFFEPLNQFSILKLDLFSLELLKDFKAASKFDFRK